jgi:cyclophilin family peptidyl-prolyl cis-trans isomerase
MSAWSRRGWGQPLLTVAALAGVAVAGCGKKAGPAATDEKPADPPAAARQAEPPAEQKAAVSQPAAAPVVRDRLHQSFADATRGPDNPPEDVAPPVNQTLNGKSAPALYEQVAQTWDNVRFTTADGRHIEYVAELNTSLGVIKMALLPELAPNHARNFLVLAKLGYYDGLRFDRIHHEQIGGNELHCVEAGCPLGTGDAGSGSVGYWMKDEFTPADKLSHTEGVVGAFRLPEADTAASKFYVNLNSAAFRDGDYSLFAKVIEGLDVVRRIANVEVTSDPEDGSRAKPKTPVIIHKVTIQERIAQAAKN